MANIIMNTHTGHGQYIREKHDIDTGVLSKVYSEEVIEEYIEREHGKSNNVILVIDVDNFTDINDFYGVKFADALLLELADLIGESFPANSVIGRVGGDTFVVLVKNFTSEAIYEKTAEFNEKASRLYAGENDRISFTISTSIVDTTDAKNYYDLLNLGRSVISYIKSLGGGMAKTYKMANAEVKDRIEYLYGGDRRTDREFIEKRAASPYDIVAYSMLLMENAKDIPSSVNMLLRRIGVKYHADRVSITSVKWETLDFKYEYRWSRTPEDEEHGDDSKITIREYYELASGYDKRGVRDRAINSKHTLGSSVEAAIYAKGRYSGSLILEKHDKSYVWGNAVKRDISLLANLFGTYLEREEDARELKLKEQEMEIMSTAIKGGFKIISDDCFRTILHISDGLCSLYGYTREELFGITDGMECNLIYKEDLSDVLEQSGTEKFHDAESYTLKYRIKCKDGSLKWVLDYGRRVKDKNGRSVFYSTCSDVTEIERSSDQIRKLYKQTKASEEFIRIALRNIKTAEFYYYPESGKCVFPERSSELLNCRGEYTNAPYDLAEEIAEPQMQAQFIDVFKSISADDMTKSYSFKLRNSDSWIKITLSAMKEEAGSDKIGVVVGIAEDISDEATAAHERMSIIKSISETYFAMYHIKEEAPNKMVYSSMSQPKDLEEIFGSNGEYEVFKKLFLEKFVKNEDEQSFTQRCAKILEGKVLDEHHRVESFDYMYDYGTYKGWVRVSFILVSMKETKTASYIVALSDISEEKKREEQRREENRILSAAISDSYDRIYALNLNCNTIYDVNIVDGDIKKDKCNVSYEEMVKHIRDKYIHSDDLEEYDRKTSIEYLRESLSETKPVQYMELRFRKYENDSFFLNYDVPKDYYWKSIKYKLIVGENNNNVMMFVNDIDERKTGELEIRQSLKDAFDMTVSANNAKSDFLSKISHDIRTPINAITGMTFIAKNNLGNIEKERDCLHKIETSAKHLLNLINDVLDMSRMESGHMTLREEEVNLSDLVNNLTTMLKPLVDKKRHTLKITIEDLVHENIITDGLRIQQVFVNLMSNAIKYTPDKGFIELKISELPSDIKGAAHYEFIFKDNGIGMSEDYTKLIFEPFTRAEDSRTSKIQGTGLGMAITKQIVNMMNGEITVASKINEGTEFKINVYFKLTEKACIADKNFNGLNILVVNDDGESRANIKKTLLNMGMTVYAVCGKEEAINTANKLCEKKEELFAVIVDVKAPEDDGLDITRSLKAVLKNDAPVIMAADQNLYDAEDFYHSAGVDCCVERPLFSSRLVPLFSEYLEGDAAKENVADIFKNTDFTGKRILLTEDNAVNMEIAAEILSYTNVDIETADNGQKAVDMIKNNPLNYYDMVLMDVQMPVMNGYEATAEIRRMEREDVKTLPIIACTATAFADDIKNAKNAGMNGHLAKPIDYKELMRIMNKWLN